MPTTPALSHRITGSALAAAVCAVAIGSAARAAGPGIPSLDLADYELVATYPLPAVTASEASAVTYDWETDTLFVIGDEGEFVVQVTKQGAPISEMELERFDDTEGLTFIGDGRLVIVEERLQDLLLLPYEADASLASSDLADVSIGPTIGNVGLEGASYDPLAGTFVIVKEKEPQRVIEATVDFATGVVSVVDLFEPDDKLDLDDLSDVQVLTTVPSLVGRPDADHLVIISQESQRVVEATRDGSVVSELSIADLSTQAEGITIDREGVLYIVDETPSLYVFVPPCQADLTDDGTVDADDVAFVVANWGTTLADLDQDGTTDFQDLLDVLVRWGDCPVHTP